MVDQAQYIRRRKSPMWEALFLVLRAVLWLVTRPFVLSYRIADLIFDLDKKAAANNLERLVKEVQSDLGYLFIKYGGRIVPELSSGSPSFDWPQLWSKCDRCNCVHHGTEGVLLGRSRLLPLVTHGSRLSWCVKDSQPIMAARLQQSDCSSIICPRSRSYSQTTPGLRHIALS